MSSVKIRYSGEEMYIWSWAISLNPGTFIYIVLYSIERINFRNIKNRKIIN